MSAPSSLDLGDLSLLDLFRAEVESQAGVMTSALLALERDPGAAPLLEELMRSAHSLKGAARIVNRDLAVRVAHAMEDCLVAVQRERGALAQERIDQLLGGVDLLTRIANISEGEMPGWEAQHRGEILAFTAALAAPVREEAPVTTATAPSPPAPPPAPEKIRPSAAPARAPETTSRVLRVAADNLSRLLGLAGESVVASRWMDDFVAELHRFKRSQKDLSQSVENLREALGETELSELARERFAEVEGKGNVFRQQLSASLEDFESFDRRFIGLSNRLYQEVLDCRMRPFADGVQGFPRMVRDAARSLGKEVRLEILGEATPVDRDVLERIEAPLGHLLRNAVDHGIDPPAERLRSGKPAEGMIRLEARHAAGMLVIEVADGGQGIDLEAVRRTIVARKLALPEVVAHLTEAELYEFLFLPGFTMKQSVTEISGRGVGLDVVQTTVKEMGGRVRVSSRPGRGTQFELHLPLTLSVLRTLLVEVAGEPYAFPLARIVSARKVSPGEVESIEGREHFAFDGQQIGLVSAHQILGVDEPREKGNLSVIVLGEKNARYGVVVDRFLGENELVVRALDPRLGKVKDISAAALMPDQSPVLIIDVEDLIRSIENLVSGERVVHSWRNGMTTAAKVRKRVLVVDDSLTVRELERKLIAGKGYEVEVAVDGMDGWNSVRIGHYDLVVTDVDMPRLDGIELTTLIKKDPRLTSLPVMIVSYKDREEDRRRGLEAGADYYLTKSSFHDATLLQAVSDLIGDPGE